MSRVNSLATDDRIMFEDEGDAICLINLAAACFTGRLKRRSGLWKESMINEGGLKPLVLSPFVATYHSSPNALANLGSSLVKRKSRKRAGGSSGDDDNVFTS